MSGYTILKADDAKDYYAGSDVPGEFRPFTELLESQQIALTLIRIPPHSDFEQGTGHYHDDVEEIYIITKGTLTMRFDDEIQSVPAGTAVRVAPGTARSHRNESEQTVEMWAISEKRTTDDSHKIDDFWEPSSIAAQHRTT